jgi:dinuclear metal center YbgI/SA1388 family protein
MSIKREDFDSYLNDLLKPENYDDYGHNGLQVEGRNVINRIAFTVSASKEAVDFAVKKKADAIIAHHGIIWKGPELKTYTGAYANRLFPLIRNYINLYGFHLPLDAHPEIGNNYAIASQLKLHDIQPFAEYHGNTIGFMGHFASPVRVADLEKELTQFFKRNIIVSTYDRKASIKTIGIVSGGAGAEWRYAQKCNLDAYLTGEISEHVWHEAMEGHIHLFACGHHATERIGICALMKKIKNDYKKADIECFFIDSENPV